MEVVFLIIWGVGVIICLCTLFSRPRKIFIKYYEYRFPNYSRKLTKKDIEFIEDHVDLLETHQSGISNKKRPFVLGQWSFVLIFCLLLVVLLALFIYSPKLSEWLTDLAISRSDNPSFLVDPFPSILLFAFSIFFIFFWIGPLQFLAIKHDPNKASYLLLIPHYETKVGTEEFALKSKEIMTTIKANLSIFLRKGVLDSSRTYSPDELISRLSRQLYMRMIRLVFSTITLVFLLYIMDVFNFVKISEDTITYSPAFSFSVTFKTFEDVKSADYVCEKQDNNRHLKIRVTLDDGHTFKVRKHNFEKVPAFLDARNVSSSEIEEQDEWCNNLKF